MSIKRLSFWIVFFLSLNFTILRSLRSTLTVVDLGNGAASIPLFELCGTLPLSLIITALLSRYMGRVTLRSLFLITLSAFLLFFLAFPLLFYPHFKGAGLALFFHAIAEVWKIALLTLLFFGLLNRFVPPEEGKKLYPSLFLANSLGGLVGAPIITFFTSSKIVWVDSITLFSAVLLMAGLVIGFLYNRLATLLEEGQQTIAPFSLKKALELTSKSKPLLLIALVVLADYVAYTIGEIAFLDVLKRKFQTPSSYCHYLGVLAFWGSSATTLSALFIAPILLRRFSWKVAALVTPITLLITQGLFFGALVSLSESTTLLVLLGSVQYVLCRAAKYTLFDPSKELAFAHLPTQEKIEGKMAIDGLLSRMGRGGASFLVLTFFQVAFASLLMGIFASLVTFGWIFALTVLDKKLEKRRAEG